MAEEKDLQQDETLNEPGQEAAAEAPEAEAPEAEATADAQQPEEAEQATDTESAGEAEAAEAEEGAEDRDHRMTREEKRAARKASKIDKEKEAMQEKIAGLEDRVKRQLAEFENFRNRTEKEKSETFELGVRSVVEKLLPVVDNFERGFATVEEEDKNDPFVDGMSRVYKQLMTELEKLGVEPIEAVGKPFDPNLHNAVMQTQSEEYESGTVAQELQKGYTCHGKVVRHSMVSVVE